MPIQVKDDRGFTLIEILVVILIIGILAAIALPMFLGNRTSAQDSEAKMNAGTMQAHVESCFTDTEDYGDCETGDPRMNEIRMPVGTGSGQTNVQSDGSRDYTIAATSASGNVFRLIKTGGDRPVRSCTVKPDGHRGGCKSDSTW